MRRIASLCLPVATLLVACGPDPTAAFVGTYDFTGSVTYGQTALSANTTGAQITKSATADEIVVPINACDLTASVGSDTTFTLNGMTCPQNTYQDTSGAGCGNCTYVLTYTGGNGSLAGTSLTVTGSGTYQQTCTNSLCTPTSGAFSLSLSGTKTH